MNFEINEGFRANGQRASLDLAQQSNETVLAALKEAQLVAEKRQLIVPEAGSLATVAAEAATDLRERLLGTVAEGAKLYRSVVENINADRKKKDHIPLLTDEEYQTAAEGWPTPKRMAATAELPQTADRPLLLMPRLSRPISHEEIMVAFDRASDNGLYKWNGQLEFIQTFSADRLSGYDPAKAEKAFVVVPTAYDLSRQGTTRQQNNNLNRLRAAHSAIEVAPIFYGAVLAERYKGQPRDWRDSYVRDISLKPERCYGCVFVVNALVFGDGGASVSDSGVEGDRAARLLVG